MAMKTCKECNTEISSKAKKCPECGVDTRNWFMKHKIISAIIIIIILAGIGSLTGGENKDNITTSNTSSQKKDEVPTYKVGDAIKTDKFEFVVISAEEKSKVGGEYVEKKPSSGGTYVVVKFKYKNISKEPIKMFDFPSLSLVDGSGVKYDSDLDASSSYATEVNLNEKILSDLNPGISVDGADVFEVSKESYDKGGWKIRIKADKEINISLK